MIQMTFFLKYQAQIKRIRPTVYNKLEKSIVNSVKLYGGNIKYEYRTIIAFFNEESFGFWLDILSVIETIKDMLHELRSDLYGHICVFSEVIDYEQMHSILNSLPSVRIASGIWCTRSIQKNLDFFFEFKDVLISSGKMSLPEEIMELQNIKKLDGIRKQYPVRNSIKQFFSDNNIGRNVVLVGREFIGKRNCLHWFCGGQNGVFAPLTIRFGSWGGMLNCFSDALSPKMRNFIESNGVKLSKEINELYDMIFMERIRDEYSNFLLQKAKCFFQMLLEAYHAAVLNCKNSAVIILENIQNADDNMRQLVMDYQQYYKENDFIVYAACNSSELPPAWNSMFSSVVNCFSAENPPVIQPEILSKSLWETAYACAILCRYFPAFMLSDLFLMEGKNPAAIDRSLDLLLKYGVIRSKQDPDVEMADFIPYVENLLGKRAGYIRSMATRLLLSLTRSGKLKPCFSLLEALHYLGGNIPPLLALESIKQDVINGTYRSIEKLLEEKQFDSICGGGYSPALYYIYKTLKSLIYGDEAEIRDTFSNLRIPEVEISNYKAQILTINAFYKMGIHDSSTAFEEIKESLIICQNNSGRYGIAQVYRLFAFINLSKNDLNSAIDYLSFAIEASERGGNNVELAIVAYYAAGCHFIFGNISKALRLAKQSAHTANISGMEEWAMRAKFLSGRFYFEAGYYAEAVDIFNDMYERCCGEPYSSQSQTISAWIYRTELYLNNEKPADREFIFGDGLLFEIEAACFSGDYKKTIELSEQLLSSLKDDSFLFLEQPDWSSGFAQCELLQISKKEFWIRMINVWQAMAISMLDSTGSQKALALMQKVIRDKQLGESDPNISFYFFANYKILRQANSTEVDRNTAISIAFKRLQRRSSRIDEIEMRRNFLLKQHWNKALFITAKEHKLI
ncbi:MAG: hypothetical protein LBB22_01095 [Treponema sp.]|jgi:hypothetical protein|nr:hypothetical protein [Treponema sp.]